MCVFLPELVGMYRVHTVDVTGIRLKQCVSIVGTSRIVRTFSESPFTAASCPTLPRASVDATWLLVWVHALESGHALQCVLRVFALALV